MATCIGRNLKIEHKKNNVIFAITPGAPPREMLAYSTASWVWRIFSLPLGGDLNLQCCAYTY